jgi:hypothetical protein
MQIRTWHRRNSLSRTPQLWRRCDVRRVGRRSRRKQCLPARGCDGGHPARVMALRGEEQREQRVGHHIR